MSVSRTLSPGSMGEGEGAQGDGAGVSGQRTCDADVGPAALGGARRAPGYALAPVILQPEQLLHLLPRHLDLHLSHLQAWEEERDATDGGAGLRTGDPGCGTMTSYSFSPGGFSPTSFCFLFSHLFCFEPGPSHTAAHLEATVANPSPLPSFIHFLPCRQCVLFERYKWHAIPLLCPGHPSVKTQTLHVASSKSYPLQPHWASLRPSCSPSLSSHRAFAHPIPCLGRLFCPFCVQ